MVLFDSALNGRLRRVVRLQPVSLLHRRLSVRKVWSGDDSVSAAAIDVTPCVRHVLQHEQRVVGGDVDAGGVISKFFCGGHLAAGPVLKDEHIRGAVDGGDDNDTVWTAPRPLT